MARCMSVVKSQRLRQITVKHVFTLCNPSSRASTRRYAFATVWRFSYAYLYLLVPNPRRRKNPGCNPKMSFTTVTTITKAVLESLNYHRINREQLLTYTYVFALDTLFHLQVRISNSSVILQNAAGASILHNEYSDRECLLREQLVRTRNLGRCALILNASFSAFRDVTLSLCVVSREWS